MKRKHLICYDISNDKKRTLVSKLLEQTGRRCQYSVFMCSFSPSEKSALIEKLVSLAENSDSILIIPFSDAMFEKTRSIGNNKKFFKKDQLEFF